MERQRVESRNIISVGWDKETETLEVEFKSGVYQYPCDSDLYNQFLCAPSKGKFFAEHIKSLPFKKVA
jgi:KTSC domain-containing protein